MSKANNLFVVFPQVNIEPIPLEEVTDDQILHGMWLVEDNTDDERVFEAVKKFLDPNKARAYQMFVANESCCIIVSTIKRYEED